jgi:hypothetical protein
MEIGQDDPRDPTPSPSARHPESTWKKVFSQLSTPVLIAILGAVLGYYFQQRVWNKEKAVTTRQEDASRAFDVEQKVSEFIDTRWAAADKLGNLLKAQGSKKELEQAREEYNRWYDEWQRNLTKWAGQIAFYVDLPFKLPTGDRRAEIQAKINCLTYTLEPTSNEFITGEGDVAKIYSSSSSHLLQIIDHCHDLAKRDIEKAKIGEHSVEDFDIRRSHIWWLNNVLRCTLLERAAAIRSSVTQTSWLWMPQAPSKYDHEPDARDCAQDYREDNYRGLAAAPGRAAQTQSR